MITRAHPAPCDKTLPELERHLYVIKRGAPLAKRGVPGEVSRADCGVHPTGDFLAVERNWPLLFFLSVSLSLTVIFSLSRLGGDPAGRHTLGGLRPPQPSPSARLRLASFAVFWP